MSAFSVQDAAFSGFAAVRGHLRALPYWTALALVVSLLVQVALVALGAPEVDPAVLLGDPARLQALSARLLPVNLAVAPISLLSQSVIQAAMYRLALRPQEVRFGFLRLGADELRQLAVSLIVSLSALFAATVTVFVFALAGSLLSSVTGGAAAGVAVVLAMIAGGCVALFLGVRLSLAAPLAFERRRMDLVEAWRLSGRCFWPLLGTAVMVLALVGVLYVFAAVLIYGLGGLMLGPEIARLGRPAGRLVELASPMRLTLALFWAFLSALVWPVLFVPSASIYVQLTRRRDPSTGPWA